MGRSGHILLLAGSAEARQVGAALSEQGRDVRALMSEPPRGANPMPVPFDVCPNLTKQMIVNAAEGAIAILDASHGFDGKLTRAGHAAAALCDLPFISLSRPVWDIGENALWHSAADVAAAMHLIASRERVFSATGWASLPEYGAFKGACLMLRQTRRHERPVPFDFVKPVFGTPPFSVAQEKALFQKLEVDTLIARNLGGLPSRPKLDAASQLGIKVILIDRPPLPVGVQVVTSVAQALAWVDEI